MSNDMANGKIENLWQFLKWVGEKHGFNAVLLVAACAALWFVVGRPQMIAQSENLEDRKLLRTFTERSVQAQERIAKTLEATQTTQESIEKVVRENGLEIKANAGKNDRQVEILEEGLVTMKEFTTRVHEDHKKHCDGIEELKKRLPN